MENNRKTKNIKTIIEKIYGKDTTIQPDNDSFCDGDKRVLFMPMNTSGPLKAKYLGNRKNIKHVLALWIDKTSNELKYKYFLYDELKSKIDQEYRFHISEFKKLDSGKAILEENQYVLNKRAITFIREWLGKKYNAPRFGAQDIVGVIKNNNQVILQGPPGTGKTRMAKIVAAQLVLPDDNKVKKQLAEVNEKLKLLANDSQDKNELLAERDGHEESLKSITEQILNKKYDANCNDKIRMVQFHPSYGYEDFIMGVAIRTENGAIKYEGKDGVIKEFAKQAALDQKNNYVLIIDEINRAPLSSVMGELLYALENREEPGVKISSFSSKQEHLVIPNNLYIIGTMNTADRSIAGMDYAMRRRFAFVTMNSIEPEYDHPLFNEPLYYHINRLFTTDTVVKGINMDDIKIGISYFFFKKELDKKATKACESWNDFFDYKVKYEIVPMLMEYYKDGFFKRKAKVGEILIEDIFSSIESLTAFCKNVK